VVFYELLTGSLPYEATNYNLLVAKIVYEEPTAILARDPSLPGDVAAYVDRALQKNRDARFPSMQSMLDAAVACGAWVATESTLLSTPPARPSVIPRAAAPNFT
jgi:serine/threonine protein kinase